MGEASRAHHGLFVFWESAMVEVVLVFGFMNIVFEFVILAMLPPRLRLRILGSSMWCRVLHFAMLGVNLCVHWGTVTGTMSSVMAFCASLITVRVARLVFGSVSNGAYRRGVIGYPVTELR